MSLLSPPRPAATPVENVSTDPTVHADHVTLSPEDDNHDPPLGARAIGPPPQSFRPRSRFVIGAAVLGALIAVVGLGIALRPPDITGSVAVPGFAAEETASITPVRDPPWLRYWL